MNLGLPARRVVFAAAFSVLVHSLVFWQLHISPPQYEELLPPLTAKLETLPKRASLPGKRPKRVPNPQSNIQPQPAVPEISSEAASAVAAEHQAAVDVPVDKESDPASHELPQPKVAEAAPVAEGASAVAETPAMRPSLPRRAQLKFAVYMGKDNFRIGEVTHQLEINGDDYELKAMTQTVGLVRLFKSYTLTQTSRGKVDGSGLQPWAYEEEQVSSGEKRNSRADFDWLAQALIFSNGRKAALPADAQDILSFLYQLSQLSLNKDVVPIAISTSNNLERYALEVGAEEDIKTHLGNLHTLHLIKQRTQGEEGAEVWLGLEYRLLPVKYRQIKRSGEVAGEIVIEEIRVADE